MNPAIIVILIITANFRLANSLCGKCGPRGIRCTGVSSFEFCKAPTISPPTTVISTGESEPASSSSFSTSTDIEITTTEESTIPNETPSETTSSIEITTQDETSTITSSTTENTEETPEGTTSNPGSPVTETTYEEVTTLFPVISTGESEPASSSSPSTSTGIEITTTEESTIPNETPSKTTSSIEITTHEETSTITFSTTENTEDTPEGTTSNTGSPVTETTYEEVTTLFPGQSSFSDEIDILIDSNFFEMFESASLRSSFSCSEGFVCSSETTEVCVRKEEGECSSRCSAECPTNSTTITTKCVDRNHYKLCIEWLDNPIQKCKEGEVCTVNNKCESEAEAAPLCDNESATTAPITNSPATATSTTTTPPSTNPPTPQTFCPGKPLGNYPLSCDRYIRCNGKNDGIVFQCRSGQIYSEAERKCVPGSCSTTTIIPPTIPPSPGSFCPGKPLGNYKISCNKYIRCNGSGSGIVFQCRSGQRFDETTGSCVPGSCS